MKKFTFILALSSLIQSCTDIDSYQPSFHGNNTNTAYNHYYVSEEEQSFNAEANQLQLNHYSWY